jgi:hypothetical protein
MGTEWLSKAAYNRALQTGTEDYMPEFLQQGGALHAKLIHQYFIERGFDTYSAQGAGHLEFLSEIEGIRNKAQSAYDEGYQVNTVRQMQAPCLLPVQENSPEFLPEPTRTLRDFRKTDIIPTAVRIYDIYIPNGPHGDIGDSMSDAFRWLKDNTEVFTQNPVRFGQFPWQVLLHYQMLSFYAFHKNHVSEVHKVNEDRPVAHRPGSSAWENDIRIHTLPLWDKMRRLPLVFDNTLDPRFSSTSRYAGAITKMYWSGGEDKDSLFAASGLTSFLLREYWLELERRQVVS